MVDRARKHGIATPFNDLTIELVKETETGKRKAGVDALSAYQGLDARSSAS